MVIHEVSPAAASNPNGAGSPSWVGVYQSAMAALTPIALLLGHETRDVDIEC